MAGKISDQTNMSGAASIDRAADFLEVTDSTGPTTYKATPNFLLGITGNPVGHTDSQTLSNKTLGNTNTITLKASLFTLQDQTDTTKQGNFSLAGNTTGTTRTYTLPNASVTLASLTGTETLTNKTITSPTITTPTINNPTLNTDTVSEFTSANGVSVDGLSIKDGALNTNNSVVTANITDAAVTPAKLLAGTGSGWAYSSWTPSWSGVTIGNAVVTAKYGQIGKTIFCRVGVILGTTTSTSGDIIFTLPVTAVTYPGTGGITALGVQRAYDVSAGLAYNGDICWVSTTTASARFYLASGTYASQQINTGAAPTTWGTSDEWSYQFSYEAA